MVFVTGSLTPSSNWTSTEKSDVDEPAKTQPDDSVNPPGIETGEQVTEPPPDVGRVHENGKPAMTLQAVSASESLGVISPVCQSPLPIELVLSCSISADN